MLDSLMIIIAKYFYLVIVFIGFIYIIWRLYNKKNFILWHSIIGMPLSLLVAKIGSKLFYDPRPFVVKHFVPLVKHAADNGFPSDHALLSFTIASLIFFYNKKLGIILFIFGLFVGLSRVYVGIHSVIDILGSFVISVTIIYFTKILLSKILPKLLDK